MTTLPKFGRNEACLCGSGKKHKHCCLEKINWESIYKKQDSIALINNLSARGKNLLFATRVCEILQLDDYTLDLNVAKRALQKHTTIRDIHEAISDIWPSEKDLNRILHSNQSEQNAFYTGSYDHHSLEKSLCRHSLYADKILLTDPLIYPGSQKPEFDPVHRPEIFEDTTLKFLLLWFRILPWIEADICNFIRSPGDFDLKLKWDLMVRQKQKVEEHPEFKAALNDFTELEMKKENLVERFESFFYSQPDEQIKEIFDELFPNTPLKEKKEFMEYIQYKRENSETFVRPISSENKEQLHLETTGTSYEMAKIICQRAGTHLITDIRPRWVEIELDRKCSGVNDSGWEPFAKSLQNAKLSALDSTSLELAFRLRQEGRLENMRNFLRKVWRDSSNIDDFSIRKAEEFSAELDHETRKAKEEWEKIDQDLVKYLGEGGFVTGAATAIVEQPNWGWLALAYGGSLAMSLIHSQMKREAVRQKFPAALFIGA